MEVHRDVFDLLNFDHKMRIGSFSIFFPFMPFERLLKDPY